MSGDEKPWHAMNQARAIEGLLPLMPEDWPLVESIDESHIETDDTLELLASSPYALAYAAEIFQVNRNAWEERSQLRIDVQIDTRWAGEGYDPDDPLTKTRLCVLLPVPPYQRYPIRELAAYRTVAETELADSKRCHACVSRECRPDLPAKYFAIKRSENICVARVCVPCHRLFSLTPDAAAKLADRSVGPESLSLSAFDQFAQDGLTVDSAIPCPSRTRAQDEDDPWS